MNPLLNFKDFLALKIHFSEKTAKDILQKFEILSEILFLKVTIFNFMEMPYKSREMHYEISFVLVNFIKPSTNMHMQKESLERG